MPEYDFTTHSRKTTMRQIYGAEVVIFEGIMVAACVARRWRRIRAPPSSRNVCAAQAFANRELLALMDMKIFVDTDSDIRLVRRLRRDICERKRDVFGARCGRPFCEGQAGASPTSSGGRCY